MSIYGNAVGGITGYGKTFILQDENGNELTGVVVGEEAVFTATDNDVREGMVYASDAGVSTGTKDIPAYRTTSAMRVIQPGNAFSIPLSDYNKYDYTQLQVIICKFGTSLSDSCACEKISMNNAVYSAGSVEKISDVTKNTDTQSIDLNINNDTDSIYILYYFTYREEV